VARAAAGAVSELLEDLEALGRIGATPSGGVTRFAWSEDLFAAHDWLAGRMRDAGLAVEVDAAGNAIGRWEAGSGRAVVVASHHDTVPEGGRYDGALGVLSGLHAIRLLRARGVEPRRPVWLVSFMDEEGARFGTTLFGSRAFAGEDLAPLRDRVGRDGLTLADAMAARGFAFDRLPAARRVDDVGAYLELHIEQGPVLERAEAEIGVVTGIVGLLGYRARLTGQANHAGTTPMDMRRDALAAAARMVLALREEAVRREGMTANVGSLSVEPGGSNVIPGVCEFTIDVRSPDGLAEAERLVPEVLGRIASEESVELSLVPMYRLAPAPLDADLQETLARAADDVGATHMRMPSGAGHDAMMLAPHVRAGMLFVPSRGGISHSPDEYTAPEHCETGAAVLARALERLVAPTTEDSQ
jgi:allantoate deiminase